MPGDIRVGLRLTADARGLTSEVGRAARSTDALERATDRAARTTDAAARASARQTAALGRTSAAARELSAGMQLAVTAVRAYVGVRLVGTVAELARAGVAAQSLAVSMEAATGSAARAQRELNFVARLARRLGIDLVTARQGYVRLSAAARGTSIEGAHAREIFTAVATASRVLGLSADQTSGALVAIEQIISKGTVSAEELRGQLGERLPGAFQIAARAMGVTTEELGRMLAAGELVAGDFLPRFARELEATFGARAPQAATSAGAAFTRLGNAIAGLRDAIAASGLTDFLADVARLSTRAVDAATRQIRRTRPRHRTAADRDAAVFAGDPDRHPGPGERAATPAALEPAGEDAAGREALARLRARLDTQVAARRGALAQVALEERRTLAAIDALRDQAGVDEAERLRLRTAALEEFTARRRAVRRAAAEAEAADATAAEERRRTEEARIEADRIAVIERQHSDALAEARRLEDARQAALRALDEGREALSTPYERAITAIDRWEARARTAVDAWAADAAAAETAVTELAQTSADLRAQAAEEEAERALAASTHWRDGARRALMAVADVAADEAAQTQAVFTSAFHAAEDALVEFVARGRISFKSLVDSIVADLARLAIRQQITGPLAGALGLSIGGGAGGGGIFGEVLHAGGGVGAAGARRSRAVDPRLYAGARRYHRGGLVGGEVPAILLPGETVLSRSQTRALGGVLDREREASAHAWHAAFRPRPPEPAGVVEAGREASAHAWHAAFRPRPPEPAGVVEAEREREIASWHDAFAHLRRRPRAGGEALPDEMRPPPRAVVEILNRGTPQAVVESSTRADPRGLVVNIVTEDLATGGPIARGLQGIVPGVRL